MPSYFHSTLQTTYILTDRSLDNLQVMCDRSAEMTGGDSGLDGEEPALQEVAGGNGGTKGVSSVQQLEHFEGEENGAGDVGQDDEEEMTSGSHDLSSSANHSPGSVTGSTSASTKRFV